MITLGIDTSNYTTSVAVYNGETGDNLSRLLPVLPGSLGLRQSEALFQHVKSLPDLTDRLFSGLNPSSVCAVGVSTRPRAIEGSYMPCFLAGVMLARSIASLLHVPLYELSHQQGHLAACLYGAHALELMDRPFLAWHLSGGTTELLSVCPAGRNLHAERIGGTSDISAGQLIDRTGHLLELPFPAGKALDTLSDSSASCDFFRVKRKDLEFSLSGVENQVQAYWLRTQSPQDTAAFALRSVARIVCSVTLEALRKTPGVPVVFSGGVAANRLLRSEAAAFAPIFAPPQFSTDNAMGAAVLAWRLQEELNGAADH